MAAQPAPDRLPDHASRMDANYALQRHIYDLTRKYYLLGRDRLIVELDVAPGAHVLEIGCGTARNIIPAARRYPGARFYGLDISAEMLKSARGNLARQSLTSQCRLARGDATGFEAKKLFGRSTFDRIMFSYTLSMIPGWEAALEQACRLVAPGGAVHLVDFGQQEDLPRWFGRGLKAWLARFHVSPRADLFAVCEVLARRHGLGLETESLFRDYARSAALWRA